jgi:O-acetyl-ADP-ribose deacetylase (regulator of RNase III)
MSQCESGADLMRVNIGSCRIELCQGDITDQQVDMIVNAANARLAGGGGVDGAIHRRGGPAIIQDTDRRYPQGCPTGTAVISTAGNLTARYLAHAVGPVWHGGGTREAALLKSAFHRSLELAAEYECRSVALPALSTGVYGYPLEEASRVALSAAVEFLTEHDRPELVRFVLFDRRAFDIFAATLSEITRLPEGIQH